MAVQRSTHASLAALALLILLGGVYGIVRVASGGPSGSGSERPGDAGSSVGGSLIPGNSGASGATGSPGEPGNSDGSETSGNSGAPGANENTSGRSSGGNGSTGDNSSTDTGKEPDGTDELHLPGPTLNDQYPVVKGRDITDFGPTGGCIVLANEIDRPVRVQSFHMQTPTNVRIDDEPCVDAETPAPDVWGDGLTPPITTCVSGTLLEPRGQTPRHACSLNLVRSEGLDTAEPATLVVDVTGKCSSASSHTCSWSATVSWTFAAETPDPDDSSPEPPVSPDPPASSPETTPQTPPADSPSSSASGT